MPTQSDYDTQKRILMEAQGWWFATNNDAGGTDTGKSQGHVHVASCLPEWRTNDTANKITSRYLTVHVRVDIHLKSGVPAELSTRRVDEVQMTEMSFRGVDEGAGNELVDRFEGMPQSVLDCDRGERCAWYFLFSGTNQSASPSCSVFTDNESATDRSAYCTAPQLDLYNSQRDGTCIRGNPTDECPGYEYNGYKQFRILAHTKAYDNGTHESTFRGIVRAPLWLDISGPPSTTHDAAASQQVPEASGWWVNRTDGDPDPGAGGYATVEMEDAMLNYPVNDISKTAGQWTIPNINVTAEESGEVSADPRELSGFRVYVDPDFHNINYDESGDRETNHTFSFGYAPPSDTETDDTTFYSLTTTEETVDLTDERNCANGQELCPGLHRVVIVERQPNQDSSLPNRDESTNFGVMVIYFVVAD